MAERKNIMDVTKPGKVAASATARPIIVGHGSMIKDPMVKDDDITDTPKAEPEHLEVKHEKVILEPTPSVTTQANEADAAKSADDKAETEPPEVKDDPPTARAETDEETKDNDDDVQDDDRSLGSDEAIVDAVADQAKKKTKDENSKDKAHQEAVEKLVDERTYFLPVKQTTAKRNGKWASVVLVVLLLALLGSYAAIDLGVLKPGFDVPYHLLKKDKPQESATTTSQSTPTTPPVPTTPAANTISFSDKVLGVSFSYPKAWGDVKTLTTEPGTGQAGTTTYITFSMQATVTIGLKSKDYKDLKQYIQAPCPTAGFTTYKAESSAIDNGIRVVLNKADRQVVEQLTGGLCEDKLMSGSVKFVASKTYAGLELRYSDKVTDKFDLAQRIADYKKDYNKYFSDDLRQQFVSLTSSVKEL